MSRMDAVKAARRYWDEQAQSYFKERAGRKWYREIDALASRLLHVEPGFLVLDIGTGPGLFAIYLAKERDVMVIGLDVSKRLLSIAKENVKRTNSSGRVFLILGSADYLPIRDMCFNAVTSMIVVHHLPPSRILEAFKEVRRVLRENGVFVLVEDWAYKPKNEFQRAMLELRRMLTRIEIEEFHLRYDAYIRMLEKAGLNTFAVYFHPRKVSLKRFKRLTEKRARELLRLVQSVDEKRRLVDMVIIGATNSANHI